MSCCSREASWWKAWPPSWSMVRTSSSRPAPLEGVVAVVPETGIAGDLGAQCHHPVEEIFQCVLVPQPPGGEEFPDLLAQAAVGLFQKPGGLLQGHLLATIDDRHRAGELLVVLHQQRVLCLQGT